MSALLWSWFVWFYAVAVSVVFVVSVWLVDLFQWRLRREGGKRFVFSGVFRAMRVVASVAFRVVESFAGWLADVCEAIWDVVTFWS